MLEKRKIILQSTKRKENISQTVSNKIKKHLQNRMQLNWFCYIFFIFLTGTMIDCKVHNRTDGNCNTHAHTHKKMFEKKIPTVIYHLNYIMSLNDYFKQDLFVLVTRYSIISRRSMCESRMLQYQILF